MKVKVPIHRTSPTQSVLIDPAATVGAQFGVNLLDPDGKLVPWPIVVPSSGGTSLTTTDDLDEGQWNLWFTNRRAQDAVGEILADSATIDFTYTAGTSLTCILKDLANSGTGTALVKITRDAKGRISGTSAATTTDLTEGTNLYFTASRVLSVLLAGLSTASSAVITAADSVLSAFGKLQAQITGHVSNTSNPHSVTKAQVGLGAVDNTSDADKPVSTAQATAIATKLSKTGDSATGDYSFDTTTLFIDSTNHRIGIGTTTPNSQLEVNGPTGGLTLIRTGGGEPFISFGNGAGSLAGGQVRGLIAGGLHFTDNTSATEYWRMSPSFLPGADNTYDVGSSSKRGRVAYFATGAINTSDAREKTDVAPLTADELAAAADLSHAIGTYQWLESVQLKGADARHHVGLTVQQAISIMQAHGLDPFSYGFICYDQWDELPEVTDPETGEITQAYRPAGDRYSFRHDELLLFIARGFAARLDALESA